MVSVVLCTYNRARQLSLALEALAAQQGDVCYEVLVIDNNSRDRTASVVEEWCRRTAGRIRYAFEPRQGLSHARNCGIGLSCGSIVAFSDDDVRVAPDWIAQIVRAFELHPAAAYIGGRVFPRWLQKPPRWLTTAHWSPLALQDYGDRPLVSSRERAICLVGANLAFRRQVFDVVGGFSAELGRIKDGIGSTEDHDIQLRIWRAGMRGVYVPELVAMADVTPDRLVKSYHRRWHQGHGRHCAAMRLRELVPADMGPMSEPRDIVTLFGSPAFVYADVAVFAKCWLRAVVRREDAFFYSNKLRHIASYLRWQWQRHPAARPADIAAEVTSFLAAYRRKRRVARVEAV